MKVLLAVFLTPLSLFAWDFTQERNTIPVYFDSVQCQSAWGTGYNYINPTFCDIDGDGDNDLIIGSDWNRVSLYRNEGTQNYYQFSYITDTLVTLNFPPNPSSQIPNRPAFCDIDNDGDYDMIIGTYNRLFYYENIGNNSSPVFILIEDYFQEIQYGNDQYPFFIDIDNDGDNDLFIGKGYLYTPTSGRLAFYRNMGTPDSVSMILETEQFLSIDLGHYCIPAFCDIDADGDYDMFLGDEDGFIHFYRNAGTPEVYNFVLETDNYFDIDVGLIASPTFCDIDGDGDYDLFVGNRSWGEDDTHGDIYFYENTGTEEEADFELRTQNFVGIDMGSPAPIDFADIDNDGLKDMFIGDVDGNINYFSNTGTESEPVFSLTEEVFQNIWAQYQSRPTFGDLDGDGDLDLIASKGTFGTTTLSLYRNIGTAEFPDFQIISSNYLGTFGGLKFPRLIDIDADGDLDLFLGTDSNRVLFYENQGTPANPNFVLVDNDFLNTPLQPSERCAICFGDIDNDGDYDLIRGHTDLNAYLSFYRNIGTAQNPNFIMEEEHFLDISVVHLSEPYLEDIDNDGDLDLFVGDFCGGVSFWRNNEVSGVAGWPFSLSPLAFSVEPCYPNPFNPTTTISFMLNKALPIKLFVYNQLGQQISTIIDNQIVPGEYQYTWDAAQFSSGIYYISLESPSQKHTQKVILLK